MLQYQIKTDSEIPASKQIFDQIKFAIASRQYPPGHRLPSTRQLGAMTGLHRNTINKIYQQLEASGLVESQAGSGIYVKARERESRIPRPSITEADFLVQKSLDDLLSLGCTLTQARELLLAEIDWRLRCSAKVLVTVSERDLGAGELIVAEVEEHLGIPVQLVSLEQLDRVLEESNSATVVTSCYFLQEAEAIASPKSVPVIPIDIRDYKQELAIIKKLPPNSCLGLVSLSFGILGVAEIIVRSLRGEDILVITAQARNTYKLKALVRAAHTIICDRASYPLVKEAMRAASDNLIRRPQLIESENYIGENSINLLKRKLGLGYNNEQ